MVLSNEGLKVLYILGSSRSGSTLLDNVLNELDGFFSVGEVRFLWERILQRRSCACRRLVEDCEIWSAVFEDSHLPVSPREAQAVVGWQRRELRLERTWRLLRRGESLNPDAGAYAAVLAQVYRSVANVTGSAVIVDSSKRASDGALLASLPGIVPYYVHLVRDSRAVVYSNRRVRENPDREGGEMPRAGLLKSVVHWNGYNWAAEAVSRRHAGKALFMRYEDFAARPAQAVRLVVELLGQNVGGLPLNEERTATLRGNHSVSGNSSRFMTGQVRIRNDDEWISRLPAVDQHLTAALTFPLLRRYRYPLLARGG